MALKDELRPKNNLSGHKQHQDYQAGLQTGAGVLSVLSKEESFFSSILTDLLEL